jgi:hypothetical protein
MAHFDTLYVGSDPGSPVAVADASGNLSHGGTALTATAAELNAVVDDNTATAAEIVRACDISTRIVTTTATALSLTVTQHAERVVLINTNSTVANTFTLPTAAGTGAKFTLINNIAQTQGSIVVAANGTTQTIKGAAFMFGSTEEAAEAFVTSATSDKITLNLTTTGGLGPGDRIEAIDGAANVFTVTVFGVGSGSMETPFSET